jgi:hypothetical protein
MLLPTTSNFHNDFVCKCESKEYQIIYVMVPGLTRPQTVWMCNKCKRQSICPPDKATFLGFWGHEIPASCVCGLCQHPERTGTWKT